MSTTATEATHYQIVNGRTWICIQEDCDGEHHYLVDE